jgi:multidrug efflux pump subunit AcrB
MIDWFARNGVAANLMMAFILLSGVLAAVNSNEEVFPEMELDSISVEVAYLGAAPEEVEAAVNVRIKEAIQGIDGVEHIRSTAYEGTGVVTIEFDLENMRIRTPDGGQLPFGQVAVVEPRRGFASIRRVDRNRTVNVTASVDPAVTTSAGQCGGAGAAGAGGGARASLTGASDRDARPGSCPLRLGPGEGRDRLQGLGNEHRREVLSRRLQGAGRILRSRLHS